MKWLRVCFLIACVSFCSCQFQQIKPIKDSDRLRVLNYLYEIHYQKEIAAEIEYQKYLLEIKNER